MSEKNRTGRPLKEHAAGTQVVVTLQMPAELKNKLQAKAIAANRSLSQEAQRRLERSFNVQTLHEDAIALAVEEASAEVLRRAAEIRKAFDQDLRRTTNVTEELARLLKRTLDEAQREATKREKGRNNNE